MESFVSRMRKRCCTRQPVGQLYKHTGTSGENLLHYAGAAQFFGSFAHRGQSNALLRFRRHAVSIISHFQRQPPCPLIQRKAQCTVPGVGMTHDIGQGFLGDAVERHLHRR
jgi:hypothetical protein